MKPAQEEVHRRLMYLLARSGQQGAATLQYRTCCWVLAEELGVEPGEATTAWHERIRAGAELPAVMAPH